MRLFVRHLLPTTIAPVLVLSCGGDGGTEPPGPPSSVQAVSALAPVGTVGQELDTILVSVTDANGRGVSGVSVDFSLIGGNGTVRVVSSAQMNRALPFNPRVQALRTPVLTDEDGLARAIWTLGTTSGEQTLIASVATLGQVTFTATANAGTPANTDIESGDLQAALAGTTLPEPFVIKVEDGFGNPVPGQTVTWTVLQGGGTIPATSTTDSAGEAQATLTLGPGPVVQAVSATASGFGDTLVVLGLGAMTNDPAGDNCSSCPSQFVRHDLTRFGVGLQDSILFVFLEFASPVAPLLATNPAQNAVAGFVDLDLDQDTATGVTTLQEDLNLTQTFLGVDAFFTLAEPQDTSFMNVFVLTVIDSVINDSTIAVTTFAIPRTVFENKIVLQATLGILRDDGTFNTAALIAPPDWDFASTPSDFAPDTGSLMFAPGPTAPLIAPPEQTSPQVLPDGGYVRLGRSIQKRRARGNR